MTGYIILIVVLVIFIFIMELKKEKDDLKCPKCGNYMSCYHFHYICDNKDVDQYTYTCKNCGYKTIMKI